MFSKEWESRANNRAVLVSRLFANHSAYPRLTTLFQTSPNNPLSAPFVQFSMKNRNIELEIFHIQNLRHVFFPPIFLEIRIIHGNKSFVFSLSLNKISLSLLLSLFLSRLNISTTFLDSEIEKNGGKNTARSIVVVVKISRRSQAGSERSKEKSRGNHFSTLSSSNIGLAAPLGLEKDASR